ncbi:MAG: PhzF family phenazine biosynthesis protein [Lysobacter sp.]|nr:PhzF family phenazine biosynthesis protein [Lysobacter sp.]
MAIDVHTVNAFTDAGAGGNPAGVVLDADALTKADKQRIAAEVGFAETAFVSRSDIATFKLEFFTPNRQIAHCGHATIATFSLLRAQGRVGEGMLSKETIDGTRAIIVDADQVFMEQRAPKVEDVALPALGVGDATRGTIVDTGNRFLMIEAPSADALAAIAPDQALIADVSERLDLVGYYVFARDARKPGRVATARMFAPRYGIDEEAGTGMAAGPLAALLHLRHGTGARVLIEQGALMPTPSPSVIEVRLDVADGAIRGLMAGGRATVMGSRRVG